MRHVADELPVPGAPELPYQQPAELFDREAQVPSRHNRNPSISRHIGSRIQPRTGTFVKVNGVMRKSMFSADNAFNRLNSALPEDDVLLVTVLTRGASNGAAAIIATNMQGIFIAN
ncbi:hypothetical protein ARSEF1564_009748 [Beauveria bassiana]